MRSLLLLAALAFSTSASADDEWDAKETRQVQAKYGACVVKSDYATAKKVVLDPNLDDRAFRQAIARIGSNDCLFKAAAPNDSIEMKFPLDSMRYALADALVRKEFSQGVQPPIKDAGSLNQPDFDEAKYQPKPGEKLRQNELEELAASRSRRLILIYLAKYGECVVRADPGHSWTLLSALPDSSEESAAFSALKPALGGCVVEGQSLKFNKATLRGTIAMNYYRLAHAPRTASVPAGATN